MDGSSMTEVCVVLAIVAAVGLALSTLLVVLLVRGYRGRWNGEVYTLSSRFGTAGKLGFGATGQLDRVVPLDATDEVHGFRLLNVVPGRLPLIEVCENYVGLIPRPLSFRLTACKASYGPCVEVILAHHVGQPPDAPMHSVTLKVWLSELDEAAEFEFQWAPARVLTS